MPQMWFIEYQYVCLQYKLSFLLFVLCFYSNLTCENAYLTELVLCSGGSAAVNNMVL